MVLEYGLSLTEVARLEGNVTIHGLYLKFDMLHTS